MKRPLSSRYSFVIFGVILIAAALFDNRGARLLAGGVGLVLWCIGVAVIQFRRRSTR